MVSIKFRQHGDFAKEGRPEGLTSGIHSGNAGDIVYSLPAVKALGIRHIYLNVFRSAIDPLRKLSVETARSLAPLLLEQPYIDRVTIVESGVSLEQVDPACIDVDFILDRFRLERAAEMHLIAAHARACRTQVRGDEPFLSVTASQAQDEPPYAVLALTPRYRAVSDEFVRDLMLCFRRIVVVGIPDEWRTVSGVDGEAWMAEDFLALARRIQGAALFIGNPNLPYAIAEGLKVPRIVDLPSDIRNAFPIGPRGYVIPSRRRDLYELLDLLCTRSESIARCCDRERIREKLHTVVASGAAKDFEDIVLAERAASGLCEAKVMTRDLFRVDNDGILLHPPPPGMPESELVFRGLNLPARARLLGEASLEHAEAHPVRMSVAVREQGNPVPVAAWSAEVAPGARETIELDVPVGKASMECVLTTSMPPDAVNSNFGWAWFRNARFVPA